MYDRCHRRRKYHGIYKNESMTEEVYFKLVDLVANAPFCIAVKILVIKYRTTLMQCEDTFGKH
jgi:hypothetical protein